LNCILHVLCKKYTNSPMLQSIENIFIYVVFFGVIIFLLFLTSLYIYVLRDMLLGHILSPFAKTLQVSFLDKFGIFILPFVWSVQILSVILALRSLYRNILSLWCIMCDVYAYVRAYRLGWWGQLRKRYTSSIWFPQYHSEITIHWNVFKKLGVSSKHEALMIVFGEKHTQA
jgi:hypothetical protein